MSMPRAVLETRDGTPLVFRSRHDCACSVCEAVTHLGIGVDEDGDYPQAFVCVFCLLGALAEARP